MRLLKVAAVLIAFVIANGCRKAELPHNAVEDGKSAGSPAAETANAADAVIKLTAQARQKAGITVEAVSYADVDDEYSATGVISVNETRIAHIGPPVGGRVEKIYAQLGDTVRKGQRLYAIKSPNVAEAESQYLKALADYTIAEAAFERAKTLIEGKAISMGEHQRREGGYLTGKSALNAAENSLHVLGMSDEDVASIKASGIIRAEIDISSPLNGTVIEKHVTLGEVIEPLKPVYVVADLSTLWVITNIPEKDISRIKIGQTAHITVSSYPESVVTGRISYIAPVVDPATRTIKVRIEVGNVKEWLKPEMFANVKIVTDSKRRALAIPAGAVQLMEETSVVFVEKEEGFEKRPVEIGSRAKGQYVVRAGLREGERVAVKGTFIIKSEALKELMEEE